MGEDQPNEVAALVTALERGKVDSSVSAIIHRLVAKVEDLGNRNDRSDQCIRQLTTEVNSWRAKYDQCVHVNNTCTQAANVSMQLSQGARDITAELGQGPAMTTSLDRSSKSKLFLSLFLIELPSLLLVLKQSRDPLWKVNPIILRLVV